MKIIEATMEWFKTCLVIFAISLSLLITLRHQISPFYQLDGLSEPLSGTSQSVATKGFPFRAITQNFTNKDSGIKNFADSTNSSFTSSTEDSSDASKLLDGLLTSSFDEGSCSSRFQSYLYRKPSPHKPSKYLTSKLRSYEELHRRCGPHTGPYNRTMERAAASGGSNATAECSYVVWTPANGLGNRMVSMAAAFLYALLADRVLLVEFESDMLGLFCEPFPNSSWILPKDFPFVAGNKRGDVETYQSALGKERGNDSKETILPSVLHLTIKHTTDDGDRESFFHCDRNQRRLRRVAVLILLSDQYFVPSLFMVPSFSQRLSKMFPERDTVFHHLGRYLFLPSNEVWGPISRFYQAYLGEAGERVGLQIRVFNPHLTPHRTIMDQVLSCAVKHEILPDFGTQDHSAESQRRNQSSKSVLVASLYPEYGESLRDMYLARPTVTGEIVRVHQPSHEGRQKFNDNAHNVRALTEIYLLSLCDVLVSSSVSSFGYVAQGLGGLRPWILYKLLDENVPDQPCERDFSMEPCFHVPPKQDCAEKPMREIGTALPYIRRCVDYGFGVKLVNDRR